MGKRPLGITLLAAYLFISSLGSFYTSYIIISSGQIDILFENAAVGDTIKSQIESGSIPEREYFWGGYLILVGAFNILLAYALFSMKSWVIKFQMIGVVINVILFFTLIPNVLTILVSSIFLAYTNSKRHLLN